MENNFWITEINMKEGVRFQNEFNDTHKKAKFVKTIGTKVNDCIIQNGNFFCGAFLWMYKRVKWKTVSLFLADHLHPEKNVFLS